jgi:hypothetical protein
MRLGMGLAKRRPAKECPLLHGAVVTDRALVNCGVSECYGGDGDALPQDKKGL